MNGIEYKEALKDIISAAIKSGTNGEAILTAELYLKTVIDCYCGNLSFSFCEVDKKLISIILKTRFPRANDNYSSIIKTLDEYITKTSGTTKEILGGVNMQKILENAQSDAKKIGITELSPDILLDCVFSDPTSVISYLLSQYSNLTEHNIDKTDLDSDDKTATIEDETENDYVICLDDSDFDEDENPKTLIAQLTEKTKAIRDNLLKEVFGQDHAVNTFATGYFQSELTHITEKTHNHPKATFLFAGPPGVGKTFLAQQIANELDLPYMRFDMSEYSDKEANLEFCGSDKVYKEGKEGNVTGFVSKNPKSILLFDEIEKAHLNIIHLFLQLLDAGRLRDNHTDKEVSFSECVIIFTTNAGKELYEDSENAVLSSIPRKVILNALQKDTDSNGIPFFPAAICSRFASGNVVMFNHLTPNELLKIAKNAFKKQAQNIEAKFKISIDAKDIVFSSLLYSEGGNVDGRTISNRAKTFFNKELFELFRLISSSDIDGDIENLESITFSADLSNVTKDLKVFFDNSGNCNVLIFSSDEIADYCSKKLQSINFITSKDIEESQKIIKKNDISFILVDLELGLSSNNNYLNIEDIQSSAREFLKYANENFKDIPLYLIKSSKTKITSEELLSYYNQGVLGISDVDSPEFSEAIDLVRKNILTQNTLRFLSKSNNVLQFDTAQTLNSSKKHAYINLFDFRLTVAVDAQDSKQILSNISKPDVTFDEIIGAEDAKKELKFFLNYLQNPKKFIGTGLSAPKGVIFYGPPGTGKTMLAKAMAKEADVTFIATQGNQFLKKYQGEGSDKVRELFKTARKYAPSIIFIDEIDAIAKERTGEDSSGGREATLTTFLAEMDGFNNNPSKPVFVMAATNFDVSPGSKKSLDSALMRRFDRRIYVDLPNRDERIRFIKKRTSNNPAFKLTEQFINNIAIRSTGISLAEITSVIELSLRNAAMSEEMKVTDEQFEKAFEIFNFGESRDQTEEQVLRTARHEAGHALICWLSGETPSYVTIVSRGNHGGYMQHADNEDKSYYTKDELLSKIRTSLGGRAAEIVYYGEKNGTTTTASSDLVSATNIAESIVCRYGMDNKIGLAVVDSKNPFNNDLSVQIYNEVNSILSTEMQNAIEIVESNKNAIDSLVEILLNNNHVSGEEIEYIFSNRNNAL